MAGAVCLLNIYIILLASCGVTVNTQAACNAKVNLTSLSVTMSPQNHDGFCCTPFTSHLQATFYTDCIDVDIGTTSCGSFDDKACYVTCSSRDIVPITACSVKINVTCDVDNVRGRYVRVRQNNAAALELCDLKVMEYRDHGKDLRNFALNAPCIQSTTHSYWKAEKAVDGNRNGYQQAHSCTHTSLYTHKHWWLVDLRKLILVSHIIIANRQDCCGERLASFTVELGRLESSGNITYTLCRYHDGIAGRLTTLNCTRSIWGQFVRISKQGEPLTLCEVEVYGDMDDNSTGLVSEMIASATSYKVTIAAEESAALVEDRGESTALTIDTNETTVDTDETTVDTDETTVDTDETTVDTDETTVGTDETTVDTDETTVDTDETTVDSDMTTVDTDETTVDSDDTSEHRDETTVHRDKTTIHSDETTIHSDETTIHSHETTVHSDDTTVHSDDTIVHSDETTIHSDETTIHSDETTVHSDDTTVHSDDTIVHSDETTIHSHETTIHSDKTTIHRDETTVHSDETTIHGDETTVHSDDTTVHSDETTVSAGLTTVTKEAAVLMNSTQELIVATSFTRTKYYYCACRFEPAKQNKRQQEDEVKAQMAKALKMQHSTLGKQIRKKSSAADLRMSSTVMGIFFTTAFSSIFAVFVLCDLIRVLQYLFYKVKKGTEKDGERSGQGLTASSSSRV